MIHAHPTQYPVCVNEDDVYTSSVSHPPEVKVNQAGKSGIEEDSNLNLESFAILRGDPCSSTPQPADVGESFPSPSLSVSTNLSFQDIMKIPNIVEKQKSKRSEESEILTSTPYKKGLLFAIDNSKAKKSKKTGKNLHKKASKHRKERKK